MSGAGCALCRRKRDPVVEVSTHALCMPCLSMLGHFMRTGPHAVVESLWRARPFELAKRALSDLVDDEITRMRRLARTDDPNVESWVRTFKAGFAATASPPEAAGQAIDAAHHLDQALAYLAMGVTDDAINEAALALTAVDQLGARAHEAAEVALDPGMLKLGLDATLLTLRAALFPD